MAASNLATIADLDDVLADLDLTGPAPAVVPAPVAPLAVVASVPAPATALEEFYGSVDKAQAEELRAVAARIKERDRAARAAIIEIGNDLINIKDGMFGHFDRWLKLEFNMSKATAWNYINVAQEFGSVPKVVEILPPATVYKLAAKATPADLRKTIVLEIEAGTVPAKEDVERRILIARNEAAEAERTRKQAEREEAEAERQKQEDEKAWQARAKELADAGRAEAEIEKERRAWDTAKAKKEREKDKRQQAKQAKWEKEERRREEWYAEHERQCRTGREVADLLREALGDRFETFRSLMADADVHEFKKAVLEPARPAGEAA